MKTAVLFWVFLPLSSFDCLQFFYSLLFLLVFASLTKSVYVQSPVLALCIKYDPPRLKSVPFICYVIKNIMIHSAMGLNTNTSMVYSSFFLILTDFFCYTLQF